MWDEGNQEPLDNAIDQVARELTSGTPDGLLKARVLEHIHADRDARASGRRDRWRAAWMLVPVAAALIIIGVLIERSAGPRDRTIETPGGRQARAAETGAGADRSNSLSSAGKPATVDEQQPSETARDLDGTDDRRRREVPTAPPAPSIVAALAPDPITVSPMEMASLGEPDPIPLPALTVPSIVVVPLADTDEWPKTEK